MRGILQFICHYIDGVKRGVTFLAHPVYHKTDTFSVRLLPVLFFYYFLLSVIAMTVLFLSSLQSFLSVTTITEELLHLA